METTETDDIVKDNILPALYDTPELILVIKDRYITEDVWRFCLEREPSLFKHVRYPSEELCMYAIKLDGYNLKYIKENLRYIKISYQMAFYAVQNCPKAILFVPKKLRTKALINMALEQDIELIEDLEEFMTKSEISEWINKNPRVVMYLNEVDEDSICQAIRKDPNYITMVKEPTEKMLAVLEEINPTMLQLYKASLNQNS